MNIFTRISAATLLSLTFSNVQAQPLPGRCDMNWTAPVYQMLTTAGVNVELAEIALADGKTFGELLTTDEQRQQLAQQVEALLHDRLMGLYALNVISDDQLTIFSQYLPVVSQKFVAQAGGPYWGDGLMGGWLWQPNREFTLNFLNQAAVENSQMLYYDQQSLSQALASGDTLADIIRRQGLSVSDYTRQLQALIGKRIDELQQSDMLSSYQAQQLGKLLRFASVRMIYVGSPCNETELPVQAKIALLRQAWSHL